MKMKLFLHMSFVFLLSVLMAHNVSAMTELGRHPFYKPPITSVAALKTMMVEKQDEVKDGLVKAGQPELFEPLMAQLPDAEIATVEYSKGQIFQWMFYKRNGKGKVRVDKSVVWESDSPMESYEFYIDFNNERYVFAMPPVCGNLALVAIAPVPAAPPPVPPAQAEAAVTAGSPGSGAGPQVMAKPLPFKFLLDVGYLHQLDPAHHFLIRLGLEYPLNENFSVIGLVGAAPKSTGTEGSDSYTIDALVNYNVSPFWVGFGLGAWLTSSDSSADAEDDDLDLILNFGSRIFGDPEAFNTSIFFEVRSAVDELGNFETYGRLATGLRFKF